MHRVLGGLAEGTWADVIRPAHQAQRCDEFQPVALYLQKGGGKGQARSGKTASLAVGGLPARTVVPLFGEAALSHRLQRPVHKTPHWVNFSAFASALAKVGFEDYGD